MESLWQSIAIILVVSFISLGLRAGAIVGLSIPLILAIVFPIMGIVGIDMQRISLGALIIALALMVDDAMTTIDAIMRRLAAGDALEGAAGYAFSHFAFPMLIGTLVTIAGFVPIGFAQSSAGEYTFSLFAVVTIALLVSWVVALVFAPILASAVLAKTSAQAGGEPGLVMRLYRGLLTGALRMRWLTIPLTLGVFAAAIFGLRFVQQQFFPSSDRLELLVDVGLPQNASIYATEATVDRLEAILAEDPDVLRWSSYIGRGAIRFYLPLDVKLANPFFGQIVVIAKDFEARLRLQPRLQEILAEKFPELVSNVAPLELGPPAGWPVQYRVSGPDVEAVREIALRVANTVAANLSTRRVNFDWFEPSRQLRIDVDQDEARLLGLSSATVASALDSAITGSAVTQVRDDIYLIDVVARATEEERLAIATLRSLQVPVPGGRAVALTQFATIEVGQEYPQVWRRDRVPTLTIQADVAPGVLPDTVVSELEERIAALNAELLPGYAVVLGGIAEESADSQASVFAVVPTMLLLMLSFLMIQLKSFRRLFVVLSVVPLGLIGVVGALLASGRPLGFVAILGILALMGMIAKNAVILIDQIETDRAEGKSVWDAVVAAASSRFRPIMLTALSTVLAMIPIAFTVFWGPMAVAVMGGLFVATLLTLVFLPTLYYAVFGRSEGGSPGAAP
jgi:multidrug efflux pump subunit AcrB